MNEMSEVVTDTGRPLSQEARRIPKLEDLPGPVDAVIALGMGPVEPQLRGMEEDGVRRPAATFERMRMISIAVNALVAHGNVVEGGTIIPTGKASVKKEAIADALRFRLDSVETRTMLKEHLDQIFELAFLTDEENMQRIQESDGRRKQLKFELARKVQGFTLRSIYSLIQQGQETGTPEEQKSALVPNTDLTNISYYGNPAEFMDRFDPAVRETLRTRLAEYKDILFQTSNEGENKKIDLNLVRTVENDLAKVFLSDEDYRRRRGYPQSQAEEKHLRGTTEAKLMSSLMQVAVPRGGAFGRDGREPKYEEEGDAENTIQNFIRSLNILDKEAGGLWKGSLAIVTSNFGHISRGEEILQALGCTRENGYSVVGLSDARILRHYGYGGNLSDEKYHEYAEKNAPEPTIRNQEKFREAIRKMPGYLLPEIKHFESDERLIIAMNGIKKWYGEQALEKYSLSSFESMAPEELRRILGAIERENPLPVESLPKNRLVAWWEEIADYDEITDQWLTRNEQQRTVVNQ